MGATEWFSVARLKSCTQFANEVSAPVLASARMLGSFAILVGVQSSADS